MVDYDATGPQKHAIAKLKIALGEADPIEERQMTMGEAGKLIRRLYAQLKARGRVPSNVRSLYRRVL